MLKVKFKYKTESWLMKILSWLLFFNKCFMTSYVTTIGNTIYLPESLRGKEETHIYKAVIAHEYIHILDNHNDKLFKIKYLFPQILALLAIVLLPFTWYGLFFLLFAAPIPAIWRKKYEVRGYTMTLAAFYLLMKNDGETEENIDNDLNFYVDYFNKQFTGSGYYWMWPFGVKKELTESIHSIKSGDIFKGDSVYSKAREAVLDI